MTASAATGTQGLIDRTGSECVSRADRSAQQTAATATKYMSNSLIRRVLRVESISTSISTAKFSEAKMIRLERGENHHPEGCPRRVGWAKEHAQDLAAQPASIFTATGVTALSIRRRERLPALQSGSQQFLERLGP
jgi:hypothetical protein